MENKKGTYICRRMRLYEYLFKNGYYPITNCPDVRNPNYLVWIYERTDALLAEVENYYETVPIQYRK